MTVVIPLTKGQFAIVDDIDADLAELKWQYGSKGYAIKHNKTSEDYKRKTILIHRVILSRILGRELKIGEQVDHIDRNKLNNTRDNLRLTNNNGNQHNQTKYRNNVTGFKGVSYQKITRKYRSLITINRKQIHLGYYNTPEEAHEAYKQAAIKYHGEFARWE